MKIKGFWILIFVICLSGKLGGISYLNYCVVWDVSKIIYKIMRGYHE